MLRQVEEQRNRTKFPTDAVISVVLAVDAAMEKPEVIIRKQNGLNSIELSIPEFGELSEGFKPS
jgi:hypothetical protein